MSQRWKRPGDARQRTTGASKDSQMGTTFLPETYATCRNLQTRYLQRRHGLDERTARMIAGLCFGEGG